MALSIRCTTFRGFYLDPRWIGTRFANLTRHAFADQMREP
jgi:hypothetical protein